MDAMQLDLFGNPAPLPPRKVRVHQEEKINERKWPEPKLPAERPKRTSRAALDSIREKTPSLREQVFAFIKKNDGATRDELCDALDLKNQTVCPRVLELIASGRVEETKDRRLTRSGRNAYVLRVTEKGAS